MWEQSEISLNAPSIFVTKLVTSTYYSSIEWNNFEKELVLWVENVIIKLKDLVTGVVSVADK